jgi:hypothetical protein
VSELLTHRRIIFPPPVDKNICICTQLPTHYSMIKSNRKKTKPLAVIQKQKKIEKFITPQWGKRNSRSNQLKKI